MNAALDRKPDYSLYPRLSLEDARAAAAELIAMRGDGQPVEDALLARIERFYRKEARLLDEERHAEWYELLADDLFYWMPLRESRFRRDARPEFDPAAMALFDESKADIAVRIGRLNSNLVWTEDPPHASRLHREQRGSLRDIRRRRIRSAFHLRAVSQSMRA
ncbi:MAG TPA: aromatic-ring-hydroxylating dioxygenase subunit beta [Phenylobacterium sp.]|uniref:aromatic-ring-hydroxylating dioxygenase subunit beta n=1 Tax=Phenylobacterium sp. TaxID=1871053 RepID=UPI002B4A50A7|nr:aromatic-ring-hydroxylating dioxygenase subunit beta [Phenylobacterium sp.]HKR89931.1 aromatic-ring-hydroxylating dioxygenase subunit beta [Phenylobacterium sp.]